MNKIPATVFVVEPMYNGVPYVNAAEGAGVNCVVLHRAKYEKSLTTANEYVELAEISVPQLVLAIFGHSDFSSGSTAVIAGNEFVVPIVATAASILGLKTIAPRTAWICRDKGVMRSMLSSFSPRWNEGLAEMPLRFPVVVKPTDETGSFGVQRADSQQEVEAAVERIKSNEGSSRNTYRDCVTNVIIEELVQGPEYSVEMLWMDGICVFAAVTQKLVVHRDGYFVERGHISPARIEQQIRVELVNFAKSVAGAAGVSDGPVHLEVIRTNNGPVLVELAARQPGDKIPLLLEKVFGMDLYSAALHIFLGNVPKIPNDSNAKGEAAIVFSFDESEHEILVNQPQVVCDDLNLEFKKDQEVESSFDRYGWAVLYSDEVLALDGLPGVLIET